MKHVYIISDVLFDYTPGMVVIVASDIGEARTLFANEFGLDELDDFDKAIQTNKYQVICTNIHYESRIVSYTYGGS